MRNYDPKEYKVVALRDCPVPEQMKICEEPGQVADYWRMHIATHPYFNQDCECFVVLLLNTRKRVKGHHLVSIGTMDTILVHPREVFSVAVTMKAASIVLLHNHPSGDPAPSDADIKVTRDLIRAGQLMKIEVTDHVIILSKCLDKITYAECWIMLSWVQPSVRFIVKATRPSDWHLA